MNPRTAVWTVIFFLAMAAGIHGDVIPPGMKSVSSTVSVDPGAFLAVSWTGHRMVQGESLERLAAQRYGDPELSAALRGANPFLGEEVPRVGQVIVMPPDAVVQGREDPGSWYFYWLSVPVGPGPELVDPLGGVEAPRYSARIVAVPHGRRDEFFRLFEEGAGRFDGRGFPRTDSLSFPRNVRAASSVRSIHTKIEILEISEAPDAHLRIRTEELFLDADGHALTGDNPHMFSLLRISFIALVVILYLAWRRRKVGEI